MTLRIALVLGVVVLLGAEGAAASVTPQTGPAGALALATALASPSAPVTGASFVSTTGGTPNGTSTTALGGFPTDGADFAILTTGNVSSVPSPGTFASTSNLGPLVRGTTDVDVTILKVDVTVPQGANCLTFDFRFLSEEYPLFVGTQFNDAFIAELDTSTWTTSGSTISAPDNFAFDAAGKAMSINATGLGGLSAANGAGTAFDGPAGNPYGGATGRLSASTQITPGAHSVYFTIFDQGDRIYDSAVFLDGLASGFVPNPALDCKKGATPTPPPITYALDLVPETATSPVGTEHTVTATLTDSTGAVVANAPIEFTVTGANPGTGSGTTNASGAATFTYTGNTVGEDAITACYEANGAPPCEATDSATKVWTPVSDVRITKTGPANAVVGGQISYSLSVTNAGPSDATNVVVDDPLPAGTTFVSAGASQGTCDATVSCSLGSLASGQSATVTIVVRATSPGTVTNTATVSAAEPDPDTTNNRASATTDVYGFGSGEGAFVLGDLTATGAVTFWGAQWWKLNELSGASASAAFKGFALDVSVPACGGSWSTRPGNSPPPPAGPLPAYIAVIVTSDTTKSGPQIAGNIVHIVVVKTDPGYAPNPGHEGTGTVVATIC